MGRDCFLLSTTQVRGFQEVHPKSLAQPLKLRNDCLSGPDGVEEGGCTVATCDGVEGCVLGDLSGGASQTYLLCPRRLLARQGRERLEVSHGVQCGGGVCQLGELSH